MTAAGIRRRISALPGTGSSADTAPEGGKRQPGEVADLEKNHRLQDDPKRRLVEVVVARLENGRRDNRHQRGRYQRPGAKAQADKYPRNRNPEIPVQYDVPCSAHAGTENRARSDPGKAGLEDCRIHRLATMNSERHGG